MPDPASGQKLADAYAKAGVRVLSAYHDNGEPMRDLIIVDAAYHAPGHCMICGSNEGPFLDTGVDIVGDGRMYLCVKMCLNIAADKAGFFAAMSDTLDKVYAPAAASNSYADQCMAVKKNGERCTARALSGWDVCVAHARKPVVA